MVNLKKWFNELSVIGRTSLVLALAAGGLVTVSAISPKTNTAEVNTVENAKAEVKSEPVTTTKTEVKTEKIPFEKQTVENADMAKGLSKIQTVGVEGVKTITYTITLVDGIEKNRTSAEVITTSAINEVTAIGTYVKPVSSCDPNYSGCVPIASDVDCAGGSGNGPAYVSGPVQVIGTDVYGLDRNGDGLGCE